jgi:hypothetical protein
MLLALALPASSLARPQLGLAEAQHAARIMLRPFAEGLDGRVRLEVCSRASGARVACRGTMKLPDGSCRFRIDIRERRGDYVAHVRSLRCS